MNTKKNDLFIAPLQEVIDEWNQLVSKSKHTDNPSDVMTRTQGSRMTARALAAIARATGENSEYSKEAKRYVAGGGYAAYILGPIIGISEALVSDLKAGYLKSMEEIIHGELFGDYLEGADHLVDNGYKDAAAVIAGSTLETHLKQLATANGISTKKHDGQPKKADALNSEIVKASIYDKLEQKNVTAWLGLRNDAAHGNYGKYSEAQAKLMISGIRDFITRNPA